VKALDHASDEALLERTLRGDETAFQELYQRHLDTIFRFAYRMLGSPEHAEDVAHDCFLSLIRNPGRFDPRRGSLRTYLYMAVRNLVIKRLRRSEMEICVDEPSDSQPVSEAEEPLDGLLARELSCEVRKAISRMPASQREVIILFEYEEQSLAETAAIVGTDIGAIKSRLHRARKWLRRELKPYVDRGALRFREYANHE
jgi:RNA polymerase sigma-70 factor (ECF subfamily)